MSDIEKKGQVGRPTLYKPEYCQMLIDHMREGYSYESFSAIIKVARSTIYEWETNYVEFSDAKKLAVDECRLTWEKYGHQGMFMGGKDNPFQASIWIFQMKNRFNWTDKKEVAIELTELPKVEIVPYVEEDED